MDPWFGRAAVFVNLLVYVLIRWPHGRRMSTTKVTDDRKDRLEVLLLIGAGLGTSFFPLIWVATGFPAFADYSLHPVALGSGIGVAILGVWLFNYFNHRVEQIKKDMNTSILELLDWCEKQILPPLESAAK